MNGSVKPVTFRWLILLLAAVAGITWLVPTLRQTQRNAELERALEVGDATRVRRALARGANPNLGAAPALPFIGSLASYPVLVWEARRGQVATVEALLEGGANPSYVDPKARTPLSWACGQGQVAVVRVLLRHGADPLDRGSWLPGPWQAAYWGHIPVLQELLAGEFSVNQRDRYGRTILMSAAAGGQDRTVRFLLGRGANPRLRNARGETAADVARRCEHPVLARHLEEAMGTGG